MGDSVSDTDLPSNGNPQGMLLQFFKDWQQAQQRFAMAQQTLAGANAEVLQKESRFKGAAELIYGPNATWEYNEQTGLRFIHPNQATRRRLAKARKKK